MGDDEVIVERFSDGRWLSSFIYATLYVHTIIMLKFAWYCVFSKV